MRAVIIILTSWLLSTPIISNGLLPQSQKVLWLILTTLPQTQQLLISGSPFYTEKDKTTSSTLVTINGIHAARVTFSGNGTTKGVSFTDSGIALITPGPNRAVHAQGTVAIIGQNGEKANFTFREIGHVDPSGNTRATGAVFQVQQAPLEN